MVKELGRKILQRPNLWAKYEKQREKKRKERWNAYLLKKSEDSKPQPVTPSQPENSVLLGTSAELEKSVQASLAMLHVNWEGVHTT